MDYVHYVQVHAAFARIFTLVLFITYQCTQVHHVQYAIITCLNYNSKYALSLRIMYITLRYERPLLDVTIRTYSSELCRV